MPVPISRRAHLAVEMGRRPGARADPDRHPAPGVGRPARHERARRLGALALHVVRRRSPSRPAPWRCSPRSAPWASSSPCCCSSTSRWPRREGRSHSRRCPGRSASWRTSSRCARCSTACGRSSTSARPGAAGLTRGVVLTAIGLVFWLLVGLAVTSWYDGRGKDRMRPEMLAYVQESAAAYRARGDGGTGPVPDPVRPRVRPPAEPEPSHDGGVSDALSPIVPHAVRRHPGPKRRRARRHDPAAWADDGELFVGVAATWSSPCGAPPRGGVGTRARGWAGRSLRPGFHGTMWWTSVKVMLYSRGTDSAGPGA